MINVAQAPFRRSVERITLTSVQRVYKGEINSVARADVVGQEPIRAQTLSSWDAE
jgi:hypothetical protein